MTSRRNGRPPIAELNVVLVEGFARIQCTLDEMADVLGCDRTTIQKRFKKEPELQAAWDRGQAVGKTSLRRTMFRHSHMANSAGVQMSIHLSKHHLGMTEKAAGGDGAAPIPVTDSASERIANRLDQMFDSFIKANEKRIIEHEPGGEIVIPPSAAPATLPGKTNGSAKTGA